MIPRYAAPSPNSVLLDPDYYLYKGSRRRKEEGAPVALSMWEDSFHEENVDGDDDDRSRSSCDHPERENITPPPAAATRRTAPLSSPRSVLEQGSGTETFEDPQVRTNKIVPPKKKRVSWGAVQVRRHAITPGDHPDASGGPPLSMEWTALSERQVLLDQFELERQPHRAHSSRAHQELVLSAEFRYELLRRNGVGEADILHSLWQSQRTHGERAQTVREFKFGGWQEFTENLQRFFQFPPQPVLQTKY